MSENIHFRHTEPGLVYDRNDGENLADFRFSQYFINATNDDVTVVMFNNLPVFVPRSSGGYSSSKFFTVRTIYHFNSSSKIVDTINAIHDYKKRYSNKQEELEIIVDTLTKCFNNNKDVRIASVAIDRTIDIGIIKENKAVYLPDSNVLVQHGVYNLDYPHPFSIEGQAMAEYKDFLANRKTSGIFIELIDNEENILNRYMYVAKHLMEFPVRKDKNRPSGVYFTKAEYDRLDDIHIQPEFYEFNEAEKALGLYKNKEEAISGGNPDMLLKLEYQQKEAEAAEAKRELENLKNEAKISEIKRTEELNRIKHEQEFGQSELKKIILNLEHDLEKRRKQNAELKEAAEEAKVKRNDYYESRSYERKDASELAKLAPALVIAVIGAFAYWNKSK